MGKLGSAASVIFGLLFVAAAFSVPIVYSSSWRDAYLVDGLLCFAIAGAEADDRETLAEGIAVVASVLFVVSIWGTLTGHASF